MVSTLPDPKRLKVLVYTSLFPNSIQPVLGNFVKERMRFLQPFADISVVAPIPYFPRVKINKRWYEFTRVPRSERIGGFGVEHPRYLVVPKIAMATHGLSMFLGSLRAVMRRTKDMSYDVIDAHYIYPDGFAAILLGSALNKPVVVSARGSDINLFPKFKSIRPLIRHVLKRADALIAVSQPLRDAMVELGCSKEKITVIENGVDSVKFQRRSQAEARRLLGLPVDRRIVLSVGKLTENKGFHILIDAIARLHADRSDVMLVIIGEGPLRTYLERKIRNLNLQGTVLLAGAKPHDELCSWYNAADLFCLASASEGSPNVVMEAMACGLPIVSTSAAREMIVCSGFGILVQRESGEFRYALGEALTRKWDHDAISAHARSNGWDRVAQKVLEVFREVVARRDPSRLAAVSSQAGLVG